MVRICCLIVLTAPASTAMVILPVHAAFLEVVKVTVYTGFIAEYVRHTTPAGSAVRIWFTSAWSQKTVKKKSLQVSDKWLNDPLKWMQ